MITSVWSQLALYGGLSSLAIWLGNNTKIGGKIGYVLLANIFGFICSNFGIIETSTTVSGIIVNYLVPFAVVLLLFQADIRRIIKIGSRFLIICLITFAIITACCTGFGILFDVGPESAKMWGALCGDYVGNMQTLAIISSQLGMSEAMTAAISASQAVWFVIYSIIVLAIARFAWFNKLFKHYTDMPEVIKVEGDVEEEMYTDFTCGHSDVAVLGGVALVVLGIGYFLGNLTGWLPMIFYVTIAIIIANTTKISKRKLADSWGVWFFNFFMVSTGAGAKLSVVAELDPMIFWGDAVILFVSILIPIVLVLIFRQPIEYALLSHMAGIGGAVSTPPMAKSYGWNDLVMPGLLIGILGQVVGPYAGLLAYKLIAMAVGG